MLGLIQFFFVFFFCYYCIISLLHCSDSYHELFHLCW